MSGWLSGTGECVVKEGCGWTDGLRGVKREDWEIPNWWI